MENHGNEYFVETWPGSRIWLLQQISRYALRRASLIRVLSEGMKERLLRRYGADLGGEVRVLPARVDLNLFDMKSRPATIGPRLRLIMVGAVNANKGQLRLIRALEKCPVPIELHIVGDGPDLLKCRESAATSSWPVICHGAQDQRRVAELLQQSDVFVMYSKSEGTPRAMMEAMATGLPVVTTDAGFCADVVRHGIEGVVLGPDQDKEIESVLSRLFERPEAIRRMGLAARARAESDYDAAALFSRYRDLVADAARR
jgi:glycosyltransferase involved in cell wall biosynthesis